MKYQAACTLLALLPALAPSPNPAPVAPQDPISTPAESEQPKITYYTTAWTQSSTLVRIATDLYGRSLPNGNPAGGLVTSNIMLLDKDRILIYETPSQTQLILDLFAELDTRPEEQPPIETRQMVTREYQPRYANLDDLEQALRPFERSLSLYSNNITILPQSDRLVLSDYADQVERMLDLIQRIDVPTPQIELTCYILRGSSTPLDKPSDLPEELTENLERLVPFEDFELLTMGVLRLSTASKTRGELEMQTAGAFRKPFAGTFDIQLEVGAFDQGDGVLTLELFSARERTTITPPEGEKGSSSSQVRQLFETRTAVTAGEYAVMGATGAEPIFVVLRFHEVGR